MDLLIQSLNESAKKTFGNDVKISVSRAPTFGHNDFCFTVSGKKQLDAAIILAKLLKDPKIKRVQAELMGEKFSWTVVEGL